MVVGKLQLNLPQAEIVLTLHHRPLPQGDLELRELGVGVVDGVDAGVPRHTTSPLEDHVPDVFHELRLDVPPGVVMGVHHVLHHHDVDVLAIDLLQVVLGFVQPNLGGPQPQGNMFPQQPVELIRDEVDLRRVVVMG